MKKIIFLIAVLVTTVTVAQQQGINYKALIKDANGNVIVGTTIRIQFNIQYEPQGFIVEYSEEHVVDTDVNGIVILTIGDGTLTSDGDPISEIEWSYRDYYLNVEVDITGGTNYVDLGTTQFMAVPYAKHADTAKNYLNNPWYKSGANIYTSTNSGKVGIKKNNPEEVLDVNGRIKVGDDPTAADPSSPGAIRWNDTTQDFEGFNGTSWVSLTKSSASGGWGAQSVNENIKNNALDAAVGDQFGGSVSISGDYAIVGAYQDDDNGTGSGSAYVFFRSGNTWTQQDKLKASDGAEYDRFGLSVAISGDYAIVGAEGNDDNGGESGSAYIFSRSGSTWTQQAKLTASDGALGDQFGVSVSISGDYAIVGAYQDDDNGSGSGSTYIFNRVGITWTQQAKLTASNSEAGDNFGISVSISSDYAIVGADRDDDNGFDSGSAYIFSRVGSTWTQQVKLTPSDAAVNDRFGKSVSISGDYAIVGADWDDDNGSVSGSAYIFNQVGSIWTQQAKLTPSDGAAGDLFGSSVSISDDYAIVGAFENDDNGANAGSAYIFSRLGSFWTQQAKLTASDGAAGDNFGTSVAISNDSVIVGAPYNDDNGGNSGSIYFFER